MEIKLGALRALCISDHERIPHAEITPQLLGVLGWDVREQPCGENDSKGQGGRADALASSSVCG